MRLHKLIANCGYSSRRRAELLIQAGRVRVNGKLVTSLGANVYPGDRVEVNGEELSLPPRMTIAFHKPAGIITSTHDTHERLTVMDLLPRRLRDIGVLPAGRLDQDTEGLLVLTNDGDLAHRITHPSFETEKEYEALVEGKPGSRAVERLEKGVLIEGEWTSPARVTVLREEGRGARARIVIREGKKRQVRRMFEAVGHPVIELRRVRIGSLELGDLPSGEWRELGPEEIAGLAGRRPAARPATVKPGRPPGPPRGEHRRRAAREPRPSRAEGPLPPPRGDS
jgi:pseudouridine synthase